MNKDLEDLDEEVRVTVHLQESKSSLDGFYQNNLSMFNLSKVKKRGELRRYQPGTGPTEFVDRWVRLSTHELNYYKNSYSENKGPIVSIPISMIDRVERLPVLNKLRRNKEYYENMFEIKLKYGDSNAFRQK